MLINAYKLYKRKGTTLLLILRFEYLHKLSVNMGCIWLLIL